MGEKAEILTSSGLLRAGFAHGFPTRRGGVSVGPFASMSFSRAKEPAEHVEENLRRLARAVGYAPEDLFEVSQVHGAGVVRPAPDRSVTLLPSRAARSEADAIVIAGGAAGVRVADCVPVLVGAVDTGEAAAIHAGWRGVVKGVIGAALAELGPGRKVAAIGPCIGACCFEVGDDVAAQIAEAAREPGVVVAGRTRGAKAHVDLRLSVRAVLRAAGLADADIEDVAGCTRCDEERFFSYRRDGERSGRHLAVIVAPSAASA
jgi:polyphenol oxidase